MSRALYRYAYRLIILACVLLQAYKMHTTGITHDEAYTYFNFGQSVTHALTRYYNPHNNHLINSVLIALTSPALSFYEHHIRLPAFFFGVLYSLSLAFIVGHTVTNSLLRLLVLFLALFNYMSFDVTFLARGYAIALAAVYLQLAVVVWAVAHDRKNLIALIASLSTMNVLSLGSMLSSYWIVVAINVTVLTMFAGECRPNRNRTRSTLVAGASVFVVSSLALAGLYHSVLHEVIGAATKQRTGAFLPYIKTLYLECFFKNEIPYQTTLIWSLLVVIVCSVAVLSYKSLTTRAAGLKLAHAHIFPLIYILTLVLMLASQALFKMTLGFTRNGVFLVPLSCIVFGTMANSTERSIANRYMRSAYTVVVGTLIAVLAISSAPSVYAVQVRRDGWKSFEIQSFSRPLLRRLMSIDPNRRWVIGLTDYSTFLLGPLRYYREKGYHTQVVRVRTFTDLPKVDVLVTEPRFRQYSRIFLARDLSQHYRCLVIPTVRIDKYHQYFQDRRPIVRRYPPNAGLPKSMYPYVYNLQ